MPYYLLTSSVAKCFQVDVPGQTTVTIAYSAPDLGLSDEPTEPVKRTTARSMSLLVIHNISPGAQPNYAHKPAPKPPSGRYREQLTNRDGTIEYTTGPHEGPLEICAQAASASRRIPARIAIRVFRDTVVSSGRKLVLQKLAQGQVIRSGAEQLSEHSSRLTEELSRLSDHIDQITGAAEYTKEREKLLHDKSLSLQSAVKFWPIVRMFVLIISAYMQTHYVVSFMKRRHII
jgi:hypothetical protein